ncbi:4a-hydroxytetrahydrobiopterin dehydratase [Brevibacillus humidisoli]|uniref:4a-hydroxytetrahydrobiopterin dehydratase n=1 Tax=Brevibacillus humidisoli TaxID=2895522 RepID=UPI001E3C57D3|nr:4a-hydroxytetrahydrobiopterin dehydratase [Brevibacillus humidisoli]UFJ43077.1 4a-hydroxytetrahydrobiopterin dehydratase [Brevibacillus humidisoli]
MAKLTIDQIACNLYKVPGWKLDGDRMALCRTFTCSDFPSAIRLVNQVAEYASADHCPEIRIMGQVVMFTLYTKSANGLTGKDFALAQAINKLL